jgi:hypothetical protein
MNGVNGTVDGGYETVNGSHSTSYHVFHNELGGTPVNSIVYGGISVSV